jgi:predicted ATPase/class 3 adenylate cyclase
LDNSTLPTGIVTFLFTDIQGSTPFWESLPDQMSAALQIHNMVLRQAISLHGGQVFKVVGDSFQAVFPTPNQALQAALEAQRGLQSAEWNDLGPLKVRMGLHAGEAFLDPEGDEYAVSHTKNRVARIMSAGHGGQIILSQAVAELLSGRLPEGVTFKDLGEHLLKGLSHPEHLFQVLCSGLPSEFPPLTGSAPPPNLPVQTTPFFGRESELERIENMLTDPDCRLITLTGIGGTGKSRLAIEAARLTQVFPAQTYFVGLANANSLDDLVTDIADAIRYSFFISPGMALTAAEAQAQLFRYLTSKKILLVLDNFEQMTCCSEMLTDLLTAAPDIKLLVTSRERLNLAGEYVVEVGGLSYPTTETSEDLTQYAAAQLFLKAAGRAGNYHYMHTDAPLVARICRMLVGIPLGLEMAAASVRLLSLAEIAAEIEQNLDFLSANWRSVPERHQTLRAVFDSSWRLLTPREQETFARLAVFHGGFTREAAAQVAGAVLTVLSTLVDKSFVRRDELGRFAIHPVLERYAYEKLISNPTAEAEVRSRHAEFFSAWLSRMFADLKCERQIQALATLRVETENLRSAFEELVNQGNYERLEKMYPVLILFQDMNNQRIETQEMIALMERMEHKLRNLLLSPLGKEAAPQDGFHLGMLTLTLAAIRHFSLDRSEARNEGLLDECLQLVQYLPDTSAKAYTLLLLCRGPGLESDRKLGLCQQSFVIFKQRGDRWGAALAQLIWADEMNFSNFDIDLAQIAYQASLDAYTTAGNLWGQALCLFGLMMLAMKEGDYQEADRLSRQSLTLFIELQNHERIASLHHAFADFAAQVGRHEEARLHLEANIAYFTHSGDIDRRKYYEGKLAQLL